MPTVSLLRPGRDSSQAWQSLMDSVTEGWGSIPYLLPYGIFQVHYSRADLDVLVKPVVKYGHSPWLLNA
ncbi:hypothetical protein BaRGS_00001444, partial [Batillaria attramentaria]